MHPKGPQNYNGQRILKPSMSIEMFASHQNSSRNSRSDYLILSPTTTTNEQLYFYPTNPIVFMYFNSKEVKKVICSTSTVTLSCQQHNT
jgi:hypothetical protein